VKFDAVLSTTGGKMSYTFTVPNPMRLFIRFEGGTTLIKTGKSLPAGSVVKIAKVAVVVFNHHDKLSFELADYDDHLLLVEEVDEMVRPLAFKWTEVYEKVLDEETATAAVRNELAPLLQKYLRPRPTATFDEKGPGIIMVI
jgi:hypothetical protein